MITLLLLLQMFASADAEATTPRFGVVTWRPDGSACATFAEKIVDGTPLSITVFDPQRTFQGSVVRFSERPCHESAQIAGTSYVIVTAEKQSTAAVGVAVIGGDGRITARMCASIEGLHLTAWSDNRRLWHEYFYLGYDVEPDCTEEERAD